MCSAPRPAEGLRPIRAWACAASVLLAAAFLHPAGAEDLSSRCLTDFKELQARYSGSAADFTVVGSDGTSLFAFALAHRGHAGRSYALWKNLNGEVSGYFMRDRGGFDFNQDRNTLIPLTWHPTNVWDRLFFSGTELRGYSCMLAGRTRLSGRKVSMLRLTPYDEARYGYVIARDEDTALPIEVNVLNPSGNIVLKLAALALDEHSGDGGFGYNDELFDRFEAAARARSPGEPWSILSVPEFFELVDEGTAVMDGAEVPFQLYSDGLNEFRVYRHQASSLLVPTAANGALTVFRRADRINEYAVVGEVPLALGETVLRRVPAVR